MKLMVTNVFLTLRTNLMMTKNYLSR